ncbi:hypothetical protein MASR2M78_31820 [Treponema sp.]
MRIAVDTALTLYKWNQILADTSLRDKLVMTDAAAWSFALARVAPESSSLIVQRAVASALKERQSEARVMDWRGAAGSSALLLFAVRMAFNIGVGFLILGAVLVIMNALVISVLERTGEIGSMRALGATRSFIRSLFILETMILTLASALVGVLIGVLATLALKKHGLPLDNPLLISLFGGNILRPVITLSSIGVHLVGAALIGSLAWIYPVSIALKIQPVSAMAERD